MSDSPGFGSPDRPAPDFAGHGPSVSATPGAPSFVVGIGASAGGLEPLEAFFERMPADTGMAFVVIQHLSPDHKSLMYELLSRRTSIPIQRVEDGARIEANKIYLIPARKQMTVSHGRLRLAEQDRKGHMNLVIDGFFRSLAQDFGERAIGIILSGSGSDGSHGLMEIHEAGGLTLVQSPESAEFDSMPQAAIGTGLVEIVLKPEDMPDALVNFIADPNWRPTPSRVQIPVESTVLDALLGLLRRECKLDFTQYKPTTVRRRIEGRLAMSHEISIEEYLSRLREDPEERDALYRDLLVGVTRFLRDPAAFESLARECLPDLIEARPPGEPLRAWVAGCGTGEEAYSVAITLCEAFEKLGQSPELKVFATDVHKASLETAAAGFYSARSVESLAPDHLDRYFVPEGEGFRVSRELRQMVVFAPHNLISDAPFTRMDLISCRNLLIYLKPLAQKKVLTLFHFALKKDGVLFLGPSETVGDLTPEFGLIDAHWKLYRKLRNVRLSAPLRLSARSSDAHHQPTGTPTRGFLQDPGLRHAYDALLSEHIPAGFLVNEDREIVHSFGGASAFLHHAEGRASLHLLENVQGDLKLVLSTGLQRAFREERSVVFESVRVEREGLTQLYRVTVKPLEYRGQRSEYTFVCIEPKIPVRRPPLSTEDEPARDIEDASRDRIRALEDEVLHTKEHLQATIEELETSNEELQATNEELQSTVEELHSVNEELYTVNAEYRQKIDELTQLTDDMDNLLACTDIGTIFLDSHLRVRRFTPAASAAFNLREHDLDRPLTEISHNIVCDDLIERIQDALKSQISVEREVVTREGMPLLMRFLPYRTEKGGVDGLVLTFVDLSAVKDAQKEVAQREARFRQTFDNAAVGIAHVAPDGSWLRVNRTLCDILGYSRDELLATTFPAISHPDDVATEQEQARRLLSGEISTYTLEKRCLRKNGATVWVNLTVSLAQDSPEGSAYFISILQDIHDRKLAEHALRESEGKHRHLLDSLPQRVFYKDLNCVYVAVNASYAADLGRTPDEIAGKTDRELFPPELAEKYQEDDRKVMAEATSRDVDEVYVVDGQEFMVHTVKTPVRNEFGAVEGVLGIFWDITHLKRAEQRFRTCIDGAPVATLMVDRDGSICLANRACERLFGYEAGELLGQPLEILLPEPMRERHVAQRNHFLEQGEAHTMMPGRDVRAVRKDGTEFVVDASLSVVETDEGRFGLAVVRDVTMQRELESRLRSANEELRRANDELDEFTYVASHDLREPLRRLVAFGKLLPADAGDTLPEDARRDVGFIVDAANRMQRLVNDLLAYSRSSKASTASEEIALDACVDDALEALAAVLDETQAEIRRDALPAVVGDRTLLGQLYQNLIGNAIKFVAPGTRPAIHLTAEQIDGTWVLGVRDNGIGIKPEQQEKIFAPFKRLHTREEIDGTGIGLAICRRVIQRHAGRIWVESEPGRGSHFKFTLHTTEVGACADSSTSLPSSC